MSYIKSDDEFRVLAEPVFERVRRDLAGEHDSQTCNCEMCVWADEYEAREAGKVAEAGSEGKNAPTASRSPRIDHLADGQGSLWADRETIRAVIFDVIDSGWQCVSVCDIKHPWRFNPYDESEAETEHRSKFVDTVLTRLSQMRERKGN